MDATDFLKGLKNKPSYQFIGKAILKINLVWNVKTNKKFIKNNKCVHM